MKLKIVGLTLALAIGSVWSLSAEAKDEGTCTVKISGGMERAFACSAELRDLNGWRLVIGGSSSLPVDFGGIISFEGAPVANKAYGITDLDSVTLDVRDKHDKDGNVWDANASKKPPRFGPRKVSPPRGTVTLKITSSGPEPTVHGALEATLKPTTFNKNKKDVVLSFEF
jgi:hypothetical protein